MAEGSDTTTNDNNKKETTGEETCTDICCCHDCKQLIHRTTFPPFSWSWWRKLFPSSCHSCDKCHVALCSACYNKHPLMVGSTELKDAIMKKYCKICFQQESTIDFDRQYDVILAKNNINKEKDTTDDEKTIGGEDFGDVIFVFLHGGGGSRQMFAYHAQELRNRFNNSSILLDLPGHGTLVDTPLTLESSKETLYNVLKECNIIDDLNKRTHRKEQTLIYVGGSLGAYLGFHHLIDDDTTVFDGAILMDCGQNVGPGASFKARAGLVLLEYMGSACSNATLMKMMADIAKKSPANYHLIETCFGAGMFFDQCTAQVNCLRTVAPAECIAKWKSTMPVVFMNGSQDYRDSENKWLELCPNKEDSELIVYEGGDHFFMHDDRFVDKIYDKMNEYATKLVKNKIGQRQ